MNHLRTHPEAYRRFCFWAFIFLVAAWLAPELWARLGGGGGYSGGGGGGSSSGGGGGGGGGELIVYWIRFCIHYPYIGLPITGFVGYQWYKSKSNEQRSIRVTPEPSPPLDWDALRSHDENFSEVLFRDFSYSLFSKIHEARGSGELVRYSQYLDDGARCWLEGLHSSLTDVHGVVVGGLTVNELHVPAGPNEIASVRLRYEANYTQVSGEKESAIYT